MAASIWPEPVLALRDRLLASRRFRRWAAAFPLTRGITLHRSRDLFDLCAGFVYSSVLLACVRVRLFTVLHAGPRTLEELREETDLPTQALTRLLAAAASLRLVQETRDGRYRLGDRGAVLDGLPGVQAMIEHHALLYQDLADPIALLKAGRGARLGDYWGYAGEAHGDRLGEAEVSPYSRLMADSQPLVADEILAVHRLGRYRRILDVGGGAAAFLIEAAKRWPGFAGTVVDLPAVVALAQERIAEAGLDDRLDTVGLDFRHQPLPQGADLITLIRILHDHDDDVVTRLLSAAQTALAPGGRLLVAEPMADTSGAEPMGAAYFGFYLLAMGKGRPRSAKVLMRCLQDAGFVSARLLPAHNPLQARVIVAEKR